MRSVNTQILKAYYTALTGIEYDSAVVPVYTGIMPDNINPNNYIVVSEVTNNDISSKSSADTSTSVTVTIRTFSEKYASQLPVNSIADRVLNRIYANTQFNLEIEDNFQIYQTLLDRDVTQNYSIDANRAYIDRILTFRHKIYHRTEITS